MKIIFAGNAGQKYDGMRYYSSDRRFYNGLVRNGHMVWFFSDRDELRLRSPLGWRPIGRKKVNTALLRLARHFKPDALILLNADIVSNETLAALRVAHPDLRMAQINIDAIFNPYNHHRFMHRRSLVDMQFFTTGGHAIGRFGTVDQPCYFIPNPTDRAIDVGRSFDLETPLYDMTCTMTMDSRYKDSENRLHLATALAQAMPELKTCYRGFDGNPGARGSTYMDIYAQSAMALNLSLQMSGDAASSVDERYLYSSDRIAHVTGNGALCFAGNTFSLDQLYAENELICFEDLTDLKQKTEFYHRNIAARRDAAKRGWQKAHGAFSVEKVTSYITERLFGTTLSHDYEWPMEAYPAKAKAA